MDKTAAPAEKQLGFTSAVLMKPYLQNMIYFQNIQISMFLGLFGLDFCFVWFCFCFGFVRINYGILACSKSFYIVIKHKKPS